MRIKLLSDNATAPSRQSPQSAGYDLHASRENTIYPGTHDIVHTDIAVEIPPNHYGRVAPRSGLAYKKGIDVGAGVIDADYRGEIGVILFNHGKYPLEIKVGDRIAQLLLISITVEEVEIVQELDKTERGCGGFGSTGN
jgi:dUTP pyrophosphatase